MKKPFSFSSFKIKIVLVPSSENWYWAPSFWYVCLLHRKDPVSNLFSLVSCAQQTVLCAESPSYEETSQREEQSFRTCEFAVCMCWCNLLKKSVWLLEMRDSVQCLFNEKQLPQWRDIKHACKQRSLANKKLNSKDALSFSENRCPSQ